jgi:hypothetical protein
VKEILICDIFHLILIIMVCIIVGPSHPFKVRGPQYIRDKKKIDAGPALFNIFCMEIFSVDEGDSHFHVATRGVVKRRIEAAMTLKQPPFLFIINFQLPGDPPVSFKKPAAH